MMRANSPGAFSLSFGLHAALVGALVWVSLNFNRAPEVSPMVFDMVDLDDIAIGEKTEMPGPPNGPLALGVPRVRFKAPKMAKPTPPPPDEPARSDPAKPGKNTPAPKPNQKGVSYDQFKNQNAKDLARNAQATNTSRTARTSRIDSGRIEREMGEFSRTASGTNGSKATIAAFDAYYNKLNRALQMAFILPTGVSELLEAKVQFYLAADGSLSAVKIIKSSGEPEFDQAVLEAFRKVRSIGSLPGFKGGTYALTFAMNESG